RFFMRSVPDPQYAYLLVFEFDRVMPRIDAHRVLPAHLCTRLISHGRFPPLLGLAKYTPRHCQKQPRFGEAVQPPRIWRYHWRSMLQLSGQVLSLQEIAAFAGGAYAVELAAAAIARMEASRR